MSLIYFDLNNIDYNQIFLKKGTPKPDGTNNARAGKGVVSNTANTKCIQYGIAGCSTVEPGYEGTGLAGKRRFLNNLFLRIISLE